MKRNTLRAPLGPEPGFKPRFYLRVFNGARWFTVSPPLATIEEAEAHVAVTHKELPWTQERSFGWAVFEGRILLKAAPRTGRGFIWRATPAQV